MFFFNETATTEIYTDGHTLSLHGALPFSADGIGTVDRRRTVEQNLHAIECRCGKGRYVDEGSRPAAARKASSVEENQGRVRAEPTDVDRRPVAVCIELGVEPCTADFLIGAACKDLRQCLPDTVRRRDPAAKIGRAWWRERGGTVWY